jgi:hypothetical protein
MEGDSSESEGHECPDDVGTRHHEPGWDADPPELDNKVLDKLMGGGSVPRGVRRSVPRGGGVCLNIQGSRAAASSHGCSGSRGGSIASRGSSRVPQFVGSSSSVGSRSVIPMRNYFNKSARCSRWNIFDCKVVCPKEKCGAQGSCDYCRNHAVATAALPELFGAAKHFRTKNSDGKLAYKYKDIQSKYVGNLDKLKLFRKLLVAFDMLNPFIVPSWIEPKAISIID